MQIRKQIHTSNDNGSRNENQLSWCLNGTNMTKLLLPIGDEKSTLSALSQVVEKGPWKICLGLLYLLSHNNSKICVVYPEQNPPLSG